MALTPTEQRPEKDRSGSDEAFLREVDDAVRASDLTHFWKCRHNFINIKFEIIYYTRKQKGKKKLLVYGIEIYQILR